MKLLNILAFSVGAGLLSALVFLLVQAHASRTGEPPGLPGERLAPCPASPNCVCSETGTAAFQRIEPLVIHGDAQAAWQRLQQAISAQGGELQTMRADYLSATFRSTLFGFVDDLEARLDAEAGVIHLRSASRVGHSDLGANRNRVRALQQSMNEG